MATKIGSFDQIVDLGEFLKRDLKELTDTEVKRIHIQVSRQLRDDVIAESGTRPSVTTIIDGRPGLTEEQVKPFGVIAYQFSYWEEIVEFGLRTARELSPVDSGRYRSSWFVMADGALVQPDALPSSFSELAITNDQPYHRLIEVGEKARFRVPYHVAEQTRQAIQRRFGNFIKAQVKFLDLQASGSGRATEVPWVLRRPTRLRVDQRGRTVGGTVTYPAIVMRGV